MSLSKKGKAVLRCAKFQCQWEMDYLFVENNDKPLCLVCLRVISLLREFNISRHYNSQHKKKYAGYTGDSRVALVKELKSRFQKKRYIFSKIPSLTASYEVSLQLAKCTMAFRDGEMVKYCAAKMACAFGDDEMAKTFKSVSLSHQTVARRISDLNDYVNAKLRAIVERCSYFSLALDDSTDISDISQLLIFIRTIDEDFTIQEELLELFPLNSGKNMLDVYQALTSLISEYGFQKCSCIVTDGAKSMTDLVDLLKENGIQCATLHCLIRQESLCGSSSRMSHVMSSVIKVIHIIRGGNGAQNHGKFISFLEELDAEYGDLPLYSEVRWLSAHKCLVQFFALRKEILSFLKERVKSDTVQFEKELEDPTYLHSLAFLTDITNHLNILNLRLQGRKQNISHLMANVDGFRRKLGLLSSSLQQNDLTHFPSCKELATELEGADFRSFSEIVNGLADEFSVRFADFEDLRSSVQLFNNPMEVSIEQQPQDLQIELYRLQSSPAFLSKKNQIYENFWKIIPKDRFPKLNDFALRMCSMFASTYICESTFSAMKRVKFKHSNGLDGDTLECCLRLATTELKVDIAALIQEKHFPQCSY